MASQHAEWRYELQSDRQLFLIGHYVNGIISDWQYLKQKSMQ